MGEQLNGLFGLKNILVNGVEKVFRQTFNFIGTGWDISEGVDDQNRKTVEVRFTAAAAGPTDHSTLTNLTTGDPHTQYYPSAPAITALSGASNTLALAHLRTFCTVAHTASTALVVPLNATVAFPIGSVIPFARIGVGAIVVTPATAGVTIIVARGSLRCMGEAHLRKVATDTWILSGDESAHDYNLVKDFGADSTGTNAADTALAAFLTEVTAAGGGATLNVPRGTYKVTQRFDITIDHVTLMASAGAKFKKVGTDFSAIGLTGNFNEVHGLEIDGNNQAQGTGIIITGSNNKVMRCYVHNVGDVTNAGAYTHGSHGITLDGQATTCQFNEVAHCTVTDCHDIGISHNKATDSRLLSNRVWNNGLEGMTCDNDADRCQFIGNRLRGNCINGGAGGLSTDSSDLCVFVGNIVTATAGGKPGLITNNNLAGGCNYWTCTGNEFIDNGVSAAVWGVYLKHGTGGDSTFWTISSNVFRGNGSGGGTVRFDVNCNSNKCFGNSLNGVAVSDAGTGNTGSATTVN